MGELIDAVPENTLKLEYPTGGPVNPLSAFTTRHFFD